MVGPRDPSDPASLGERARFACSGSIPSNRAPKWSPRPRLSKQEGMKTLRQNALQKVLDGVTTVEEVLRVTLG